MVLDKILKKLEDSTIFKSWFKINPNYYLVHAFLMIDPQVKPIWQIGYYDKKKDKMITFDVGDEIVQNPESEVFKSSGVVKKLDLNEVKIDYKKAMSIVEKFAKKQYPHYSIDKKIIILQNLDEQVWNTTFISNSFGTLNIKLNAADGKVFHHNLSKIFSFDEGSKDNNS